MEAQRILWESCGWVSLARFSNLPGIRNLADKMYVIWAKYRFVITRRPPLEKILREREDMLEKLKKTD